MDINHSFIADATSEVANRLNNAIEITTEKIGHDRLERIRSVQKKVDALNKMGLLNRQGFAAATRADFQKCFMKSTNV